MPRPPRRSVVNIRESVAARRALGQGVRLQQVPEDLLVLAEGRECRPQVEAQIDGLLERLAALG